MDASRYPILPSSGATFIRDPDRIIEFAEVSMDQALIVLKLRCIEYPSSP